MLRTAIVFGLCIAVAGCSSTGIGANSSVSQFDGSRTVQIEPHGLAGGAASVGARWTSGVPESAFLTAELYQIKSIDGLQLNIDGQIVDLRPSSVNTSFNRLGAVGMSRKDFLVGLATVRSIVASQRTAVRVNTPDGSIEGLIKNGSQDSKAYNALVRFLAEIDSGSS